VWSHPDLLPGPEDLDDPLGFREGLAEPEALTDAEFDAAIADLLDSEAEEDSEGGDDADSADSGDSGDSGTPGAQ
jgi:hypothetical protein